VVALTIVGDGLYADKWIHYPVICAFLLVGLFFKLKDTTNLPLSLGLFHPYRLVFSLEFDFCTRLYPVVPRVRYAWLSRFSCCSWGYQSLYPPMSCVASPYPGRSSCRHNASLPHHACGKKRGPSQLLPRMSLIKD